jgi:hypothetical protein
MKAATEIKLDKVIRDGFCKILKSLGFKKRLNNFHLQKARFKTSN